MGQQGNNGFGRADFPKILSWMGPRPGKHVLLTGVCRYRPSFSFDGSWRLKNSFGPARARRKANQPLEMHPRPWQRLSPTSLGSSQQHPVHKPACPHGRFPGDRGATCSHSPRSFLRALRKKLKLSQEQFASRFHLPRGTVRDWEQDAHRPDKAAQILLRIIARAPDAVVRAIKS